MSVPTFSIPHQQHSAENDRSFEPVIASPELAALQQVNAVYDHSGETENPMQEHQPNRPDQVAAHSEAVSQAMTIAETRHNPYEQLAIASPELQADHINRMSGILTSYRQVHLNVNNAAYSPGKGQHNGLV